MRIYFVSKIGAHRVAGGFQRLAHYPGFGQLARIAPVDPREQIAPTAAFEHDHLSLSHVAADSIARHSEELVDRPDQTLSAPADALVGRSLLTRGLRENIARAIKENNGSFSL